MFIITGVDETVIVTLKFSGKRMAVFTYSSSIQLPNEALIVGTKGTIQVDQNSDELTGKCNELGTYL